MSRSAAAPPPKTPLWRRWLPRGLAGQLIALLVGGLLVSHLVGVVFLSRNQGRIHPIELDRAADVFTRMVRAVDGMPRSDAARVLAAASDAWAGFTLADSPLGVVSSEGVHLQSAEEVQNTVMRRLQPVFGPADDAVRACLGSGCAAAGASSPEGFPSEPLVLQARRADGDWVQATIWPRLRRRWWWPVSFWLQASLVPIFIAVGLAARGLLRPGRALVVAAGRVSRGERVEPLRIEGPREMREILQAFNQMQARIARFVDDRTRMLAAISHDFRTPITSLRLRAEMIDDAALREPMVRTLDEMRSMVDETLQFARDDAQREPTHDTSLNTLLDELIADRQALGHDVRWADAPAASLSYRCRPVALKRAVGNLIDNAVRYGHEARVRLSLGERDQQLRIDIDDRGPGIAPGQLEAAFAPFARLRRDGAASGTGGAGLGLSIARSCAQAHGGDVTLRPLAGGRGLRARLTLPL